MGLEEEIKQKVVETDLSPHNILRTPLLNKGTSFTEEERVELGLCGLLPHHVSTMNEQLLRRYYNFKGKTSVLSKYLFLSNLQDRNEILFYRLVHENCEEMLPYIYTPTVGEAALDYSNIYSHNRGLYIAYPYKDRMKEIIGNIPKDHIDVIVVTDGSRILGLGDVGIGGMTIPIGKLSLYTLFGGIDPARTFPVVLDVGTNNSSLLNDPLYLGWRNPRITGADYDAFVDSFVTEIKKRYPEVLLQWEDFSKEHAAPLLKRYQDKICSFNDDIQGTASVALAAILSSLKSINQMLKDQIIAIAGGGSAGLGIASILVKEMIREGLTEEEALNRFYVVDKDGLLHKDQDLNDINQIKFARTDDAFKSWKVDNSNNISLEDVVINAKPNILLGLSAQAKLFTQSIIEHMCKNSERPIIFPLSNPTSKAEASPYDITRWSNGKAIIATGSPPCVINYEENKVHIAQCNNVYIFPGVGLGIIATKSSVVTDEMFLIAADVLSGMSPLINDPNASIFPHIKDLRRISRLIGLEIAKFIISKGYSRVSCKDAETLIKETLWFPEYPIIKKAKR